MGIIEDFDDLDLPEYETPWFSASKGLDWINSLCRALESQDSGLSIDSDLLEHESVLSKAKDVNAKWNLELDV